ERQQQLARRVQDHLLRCACREKRPLGQAAILVSHRELRGLGRREDGGNPQPVVQLRRPFEIHLDLRDRHLVAVRESVGGGEPERRAERVARHLEVQHVVAVPDDAVRVHFGEAHLEGGRERAHRHGVVRTAVRTFPPAPKASSRIAPTPGFARSSAAARASWIAPMAGFSPRLSLIATVRGSFAPKTIARAAVSAASVKGDPFRERWTRPTSEGVRLACSRASRIAAARTAGSARRIWGEPAALREAMPATRASIRAPRERAAVSSSTRTTAAPSPRTNPGCRSVRVACTRSYARW